MVWELAWWGNSSDGNKVRTTQFAASAHPTMPVHRKRWVEKISKLLIPVIGPVVHQRQHPPVPKLEVNPSRERREGNHLNSTRGRSIHDATENQGFSYS